MIAPAGTGLTELDHVATESQQWTFDSFALDEIQGTEIYRSCREGPEELEDSLLGSNLQARDHLGCGIAIIWTGAPG